MQKYEAVRSINSIYVGNGSASLIKEILNAFVYVDHVTVTYALMSGLVVTALFTIDMKFGPLPTLKLEDSGYGYEAVLYG